MKTDRWTAYGKWRSGVYPDADPDGLTDFFLAYYNLMDLKVISVQLKPYVGIELFELEYPERQIEKHPSNV